ncbi:MAG: crotonase [Gammaproteobacteria bacterium]|nr:crotonase [Gammaproteobacteria bacterium]
MKQYQHWHCHTDDKKIFFVEFDRADKSANAINYEVLQELSDILTSLSDQSDLQQVVFCSKKPSGFIAGADILEVFENPEDHEKRKNLIEYGQQVYHQLSALPQTTIALIHGYCLGGGFELALACDWRIVIDSPSVRIGLPEVQLGLQPGWGGSVRLMRLIGVMKTFDLILSGRTLKAKQAKALGVVDAVVPERVVKEAIMHFQKKRPRKLWSWDWLWALYPARKIVSHIVQTSLKKKVSAEHYPAPYAMIKNWEEIGHRNHAAFDREVQSITALSETDTAKHLIHIFAMKDRIKKSKSLDTPEIHHVHVVGAGVMGGDIAAWIALKGMTVTLQDLSAHQIQVALGRATTLINKHYALPFERQQCLDRLMPDVQGIGAIHADLIIEAVSEQLGLKVKILKDLEDRARPDAIIATNTSTIPLEQLDDVLKHPNRLIGIHFFNPVAQMPLVEIVVGDMTHASTTNAAYQFVQKIDKIPIKVKSAPGFFVNRVLLPYMLEAMTLYQEGAVMDEIDAAARAFGMPMGPIELADTVGLDVCLAALSSMKIGKDNVIAELQRRIQEGSIGKKSGEGFYQYHKGKSNRRKKVSQHHFQKYQDRLIFALCNEALAAWDDRIVENMADADLASIFGFGFPPFRGGILTYIREKGAKNLLEYYKPLLEDGRPISNGWMHFD